MEKSIIRQKYIDKIKPFIGKNIIKVLTGARRVGKTTILKQIIDEVLLINKDAGIIYLNMEEHEFRDIKNDELLYNFVIEKTKINAQNFIFVDEIQEVDRFEIALRQLLVKSYDIYCTGSNANMLSSDLATHLSGRYVEFQINSLSYNEFLQFHQLENTNDSLNAYIKYGGLPYLIHLTLDEDIVYGYLRSIYNSIILKDVVARYNVRDVDFLERLIEYLSDNMGSYVSSNKISDFLKSQQISLSINTVLNYLKFLCNAYFIHKVQRYDIIGKRRFEVNDKYFFSDLGLKHSVSPYKPNDVGRVFENLVYKKLIESDFVVFVGKLNNLEIDFVARRNDTIIYIQVAYLLPTKEVIDREFGNLMKIKDNHRKMVISADEFLQGNFDGVQFMNLRDFLTQDI